MAKGARNVFREYDAKASKFLSPAVKWIIYVTSLIFLLQVVFRIPFAEYFGASFRLAIMRLQFWRLFTYALVHAGFWHLVFNLLALFFFGRRIEYRWGTKRFSQFVVLTAAGAVMTHLLVGALFAGVAGEIIIGLSGVIYGILLVTAYYYPAEPIYLYGIFPVKSRTLVIALGVLAFISSIRGNTGVAHLTHLGGLLVAWLYLQVPVWLHKSRSLRKP